MQRKASHSITKSLVVSVFLMVGLATAARAQEAAPALELKDQNGKVNQCTADGMFVEKALTPNIAMIKDIVEVDELGRIIVDSAYRTNVPGLFAAGDVTSSYVEQVPVAVGEGAKAALSADEYLLPSLYRVL